MDSRGVNVDAGSATMNNEHNILHQEMQLAQHLYLNAGASTRGANDTLTAQAKASKDGPEEVTANSQ
jgi:hypothetical protein